MSNSKCPLILNLFLKRLKCLDPRFDLLFMRISFKWELKEKRVCQGCHGSGKQICNVCSGAGTNNCLECAKWVNFYFLRWRSHCISNLWDQCLIRPTLDQQIHPFSSNQRGQVPKRERDTRLDIEYVAYVQCPKKCNNGRVRCTTCSAQGMVTCKTCKGSGQLVHYLELTRTFTDNRLKILHKLYKI